MSQQPPAKREFEVFEQDQFGTLDRQAVRQMMLDVESSGHLLGGAFTLIPIRYRYSDGRVATVGWKGRQVYAPVIDVDDAPQAEPHDTTALEDDLLEGAEAAGIDDLLDDEN